MREGIDMELEKEIDVVDLASWKEALEQYYGPEASTKPRLVDIALIGDTRSFLKTVSEDKGTMLERVKSVPPLTPRQYSISVIQSDERDIAEFLYLTIREWPDGIASRQLIHSTPGTEVMFQIQRSKVLQRHSKAAPVIYFASGTGISPFTYFYSDNTFPHDQWLIWMAREISPDMRSDFKFVCKYNQRLTVDVLQTNPHSADDKDETLLLNCNVHHLDAPRNQRMRTFFNGKAYDKKLGEWLKGDAMIYVCGNIGFTMEVINVLIDYGAVVEDMVASGSLRVECFGSPGWIPSGQKKIIAPWEILKSSVPSENLYNSPLMIIGNGVFELSKTLLDIHPGGKDIILLYQGSDATKPWVQIGHNKDGTAVGMLQAFEVGSFDPLLFKSSSGQDCDIVRLGFDCAEMRNCFLLEESALVDKEDKFYQSEFYRAHALKTHRRVLAIHFSRLHKIVQQLSDHFFPDTAWEVSLDKVEVEISFNGWTKFQVLNEWEKVLSDDNKFMTANVLSAAHLIEAVATEASENQLKIILESWRKTILSFWAENCIND